MTDSVQLMSRRTMLIFALRLFSLAKLFLSIFLAYNAKWTIGRGIFAVIYILLDVTTITAPYISGTNQLMVAFYQPIITLVVISVCGFVKHEVFPSIHSDDFICVCLAVVAVCFCQFVLVLTVAYDDVKELQEQEKKSQTAVIEV